jgi:hypothetical protein
MTPLLYFVSFGWMLVLFASLIGCVGWVLINLCRSLAQPPDPVKQTGKKQLKSLNLNHLKRAGQ